MASLVAIGMRGEQRKLTRRGPKLAEALWQWYRLAAMCATAEKSNTGQTETNRTLGDAAAEAVHLEGGLGQASRAALVLYTQMNAPVGMRYVCSAPPEGDHHRSVKSIKGQCTGPRPMFPLVHSGSFRRR